MTRPPQSVRSAWVAGRHTVPTRTHGTSHLREIRKEKGFVTTAERPRTLGELKASGYQVLPVREEMRKNLIAKIRSRAKTSSPASSATKRPSSRTSRTPSSPARTSSSWANAARRSPASSARSPRCSTTRPRSSPAARSTKIRSTRSPGPAATSSKRRVTTRPIEWLARDDRYGEKLATPGHHDRRPHRRGRPDQGRRGPLPRPTS